MSRASAPPGAAILMYHSIARTSTTSLRRWTVDPRLFAEHLDALIDSGARLVTVAEIPRLIARTAATAGERPIVAISIDDGFADAASDALPVLAARRAPGTLFVPTAYVGRTSSWLPGEDGRRPMLSWDALAGVAACDGIEIGSHGHLHLACDVNRASLVREDASRSRIELEDRLGEAVPSFAYPFGYCTAAAATAVREAGFAQACTVAQLPAVASDDRFALPRIHVGPHTNPQTLARLVRHRPSDVARRWAFAKQALWRGGRRRLGWGPLEARDLRASDLAGLIPATLDTATIDAGA